VHAIISPLYIAAIVMLGLLIRIYLGAPIRILDYADKAWLVSCTFSMNDLCMLTEIVKPGESLSAVAIEGSFNRMFSVTNMCPALSESVAVMRVHTAHDVPDVQISKRPCDLSQKQ
jgi:hypothetical protein